MIQALKSSVLGRLPHAPATVGAAPRGGFGSRFAAIQSGELSPGLFHFMLNVVLVRTLSQHDYGLFAIVVASGAVGIAYIRTVVAVPATLFVSRSLGLPALISKRRRHSAPSPGSRPPPPASASRS